MERLPPNRTFLLFFDALRINYHSCRVTTCGHLFRVRCDLINNNPYRDTARRELKHQLSIVIHLFARWGEE